MCDWDVADYEEYLLWVEGEKARVRARSRPVAESPALSTVASLVSARELVEA
jgi:hypothetical protein